MEDVEIQKRLRRAGKFRKLNAAVTTSARRFKKEGTMKQLVMDALLVGLYKFGIPPERLKRFLKNTAKAVPIELIVLPLALSETVPVSLVPLNTPVTLFDF